MNAKKAKMVKRRPELVEGLPFYEPEWKKAVTTDQLSVFGDGCGECNG